MEFFVPISIVIIIVCLAMINDYQKKFKHSKTELNQAHSEIKRLKFREEKVSEELKLLKKQEDEKRIEEEEEEKSNKKYDELFEEEEWFHHVDMPLSFLSKSPNFERWKRDPNLTPELIKSVQEIIDRIISQNEELMYFLKEFRAVKIHYSNEKQKELAQLSRKRLTQISQEFQNLVKLAPELMGPVRLELEGLNWAKSWLEYIQNYVNKYASIPIKSEATKFEVKTEEQLQAEHEEKIQLLKVLLKELKIEISHPLV